MNREQLAQGICGKDIPRIENEAQPFDRRST
jgi:hypothetical protein